MLDDNPAASSQTGPTSNSGPSWSWPGAPGVHGAANEQCALNRTEHGNELRGSSPSHDHGASHPALAGFGALSDCTRGTVTRMRGRSSRTYALGSPSGTTWSPADLATQIALCCLRLGDLTAAGTLDGWAISVGRGFGGCTRDIYETRYTRAFALSSRTARPIAPLTSCPDFRSASLGFDLPRWVMAPLGSVPSRCFHTRGKSRQQPRQSRSCLRLCRRPYRLAVRGTYARWLALAGERLMGRPEQADGFAD